MVKAGYKQTDIGMIPEDWKVEQFKDISLINQGLQIPISQRLKFPTIDSKFYITIQALNNGKDAEYIENYTNNVVCDLNDILMTRTGNTGVVVTNIEGVFHNNFFKINFNRKILDKKFLVYFLSSKQTQRLILEKAGTSTIPDLNHNDFYSIYLPIPPKQEQQAIAKALSDTDELIISFEKLIAKKQAIKQGTMQQLLTGKKRLSSFCGEWEEKKLGDVSSISRGASPRPIEDPKWFDNNSEIGWVRISDISKTTKFLNQTVQKLSLDGVSQSRFVKKGSLIMSICATLGKPILTNLDSCIHDGFVVFNNLQIDIEFLYYFLFFIENGWSKSGQTGSQMNLNTELINSTTILLPPTTQEQQAIAKILSDMDNEIESLKAKLSKTKAIKDGMMSELLTGKTRLEVKDE